MRNGLCCVLGLNALQLLNAAAAGSGPNPSSMPNSYGLSHHLFILVIVFFVSRIFVPRIMKI